MSPNFTPQRRLRREPAKQCSPPPPQFQFQSPPPKQTPLRATRLEFSPMQQAPAPATQFQFRLPQQAARPTTPPPQKAPATQFPFRFPQQAARPTTPPPQKAPATQFPFRFPQQAAPPPTPPPQKARATQFQFPPPKQSPAPAPATQFQFSPPRQAPASQFQVQFRPSLQSPLIPSPESAVRNPQRSAKSSLIYPQPAPTPAPAAQFQQGLLYTKERVPAEYSTKWEDLHPESQNLLRQIEERILEYKDESLRLDQCSRLYEASVSSDSFQLDVSQIMQELGEVSIAMEIQKGWMQQLLNEVHKMSWNIQIAVDSYMMVRSKFLDSNISSNSTTVPANQIIGAMGKCCFNSQPISSSMVPLCPKRPSPFLQLTVARFERCLTECCRWIDELEQLVKKDTDKSSSSSEASSIQSVPSIMSDVHAFFVHVAANVERLHQCTNSMKTAYLAYHRAHGDVNNPFLEADRKEAARQEAAARRGHPTLHLPSVAQPSTPDAGFFASLGMPVSSVAQPSAWSSEPASVSSFFSTPVAASAPATSNSFTPSACAPITNLFGSTGFSPQATSYGPASPSPFRSAQNPSQPGANTRSFGSTPIVGSSSFPLTSSSAPIANLFRSTGFSAQPHSGTASPSRLRSAQNPSQFGASPPFSTPAVRGF